MTMRLFLSAISKFTLGLFLVGAMIFLPAGSWHYWQGWLFLAVLFVPMFLAGLVMMGKNPALLESRLRSKEAQKEQRLVIRLSGLMFAGGFLLAGFNFRFRWLILPDWVTVAAAVVFLLAYGLYGEVLRENTFLSRTIEVQAHQTVVDTGLYGIVRHPMYSVTVLLFLMMPLILGCLWSFLLFLVYPALLVRRIHKEEQFLTRELEGYEAYCRKVRWRMIPFLY